MQMRRRRLVAEQRGAFNGFNKSGSKGQRTLVAERKKKGGNCWDFFPDVNEEDEKDIPSTKVLDGAEWPEPTAASRKPI